MWVLRTAYLPMQRASVRWVILLLVSRIFVDARLYSLHSSVMNIDLGAPRTPLISSYQMGVHHVQLTGALHVNKSRTVVSTLTFLKSSVADNGSLVRLADNNISRP